MAKLIEMSEEYLDLLPTIQAKNCGILASYGLNFRYISTTKSNVGIKVAKGNPVAEFLSKEEQIITVILYEAAFDMLTDEQKEIVVTNAFNNVEYVSEKDKVTIKNNGTGLSEATWLKYKDKAVEALFSFDHAIRQIDEMEKEAKQAKKEGKQKNF